jgi:trans-aconitate methyltransferase
MTNMKWDANLYDNNHAFVFSYGEDLISLLKPEEGERILDLGCGTGHLTGQIASRGAEVTGIDNSPEMISKAKASYPGIFFEVMNGKSFSFREKFDAVFSNAVLHWIPEAEQAARNIFNCLNDGGRMVVEFGGKGNNGKMLAAMRSVLLQHGYHDLAKINFWYYPSIGEYASLLESVGFRVAFASHFSRKTLLEGSDGMKNWFKMFGANFFSGIDEREEDDMLSEIESSLRLTHLEDEKWYADYMRIRVVAVKE